MPCRDGEGYRVEDGIAIKTQLDRVTQHLCWTMGTITSWIVSGKISGQERQKILDNKKLMEWWTCHQKSDRKRVLDEMRNWAKDKPYVTEDKTTRELFRTFIEAAKREHAVSAFHKEWFMELAHIVAKETAANNSKKQQALNKLTDEDKEVLGLI